MNPRLLFCALAVCAALLTGCGGDEEPIDLTLIVGGEPESLDPAEVRSLLASRIADSLFEGLTNLNIENPNQPLPGLAVSWETADEITYIFHLRDASWSNGKPITAQDFVYSWKRVLTKATGSVYADFMFYIKNGRKFYNGKISFVQVGVRAIDSRTLKVVLETRTPQFLQLTAFTTFRPVDRDCVETNGLRWTQPDTMVCSGPYVLEGWRINHRIVLRRNARYWDAANVRSRRVAFLSVVSENTTFNLYEAGRVDIITRVPGPILETLMKRDDFHGSMAFGTYFIRFNTARKPFDDPRVRLAFSLAMNREAIAKHVTRGFTVAANGFVPPDTPGYTGIAGIRFDPQRARQLLAEAGFPDGKGFPKVKYLFAKSENNTQIALVLAATWKRELNVDVGFEDKEWGAYLEQMERQEFDLARGSWYGDYVEPSTFLAMFTTKNKFNQTGWSDRMYDKRVGAATAQDYRVAERMLVEQAAPIAPVVHFQNTNMYRASVKGMVSKGNPRNVIRIKDIYVDKSAGPPPKGKR